MATNEEENKSFNSQEGEIINYTTKVVDPVDQTFADLDEKSKDFIAYSFEDINDIFKLADMSIDSMTYTAKDLDDLIDIWNNNQSIFSQLDEELFVNAVGTAFGEYLNNVFDTKWQILTDEYGTDYCCKSTGTNKFELFPFSSVWKAIEEKREKSLNAILSIVKKNIKESNESKINKE